MFLLATLPKILVFVFLFASMLALGLQTSMSDLRSLAETQKGILGRSLAVNFLIIPIAGVVLAKLMPLQPEVADALILLACTPGGVSALQFTSKIKGASAFAGVLGFLLSLLSALISPALLTELPVVLYPEKTASVPGAESPLRLTRLSPTPAVPRYIAASLTPATTSPFSSGQVIR